VVQEDKNMNEEEHNYLLKKTKTKTFCAKGAENQLPNI